MRLPEFNHVWAVREDSSDHALARGRGEMLQESRFTGTVGPDDKDLLTGFELDRQRKSGGLRDGTLHEDNARVERNDASYRNALNGSRRIPAFVPKCDT